MKPKDGSRPLIIQQDITKAAASNGWEAGRYLKDRYEGFSKQRAHSLCSRREAVHTPMLPKVPSLPTRRPWAIENPKILAAIAVETTTLLEPATNALSLKEEESSPIEEQDANQSSSVEPTRGQWREKTEKELTDECKVWEETNQGQYTQAYRHGRCQLCQKPVSTTNLNPETELT